MSAAESTRPVGRDHSSDGRTVHAPRLEAAVDRMRDGWSIVLPVRAEDIQLHKRVVVYEDVSIQREYVEDVEHISDTVRQEELDVRAHGRVHAAAGRTWGGQRQGW
jgi:uncharacterized protein (TIGR02271 family)